MKWLAQPALEEYLKPKESLLNVVGFINTALNVLIVTNYWIQPIFLMAKKAESFAVLAIGKTYIFFQYKIPVPK